MTANAGRAGSLTSPFQRPEEGGGYSAPPPAPPVERPHYRVRFTWVVVGALLLAAALGGVSTDPAQLRHLGARPPLYGFNPRPDHLILPLFLHFGWTHFLCNLWSWLVVAASLEGVAGGLCVAYVFFFSGIASLLVALFHAPQTMSIGCSGAVFGVWAARVVHSWCRPQEEDRYRFVGLFVLSVGLTAVPQMLGMPVDNWGHFGGMAAGALGYLAFRAGRLPRWLAMLLLLGFAGWVARPPWTPF